MPFLLDAWHPVGLCQVISNQSRVFTSQLFKNMCHKSPAKVCFLTTNRTPLGVSSCLHTFGAQLREKLWESHPFRSFYRAFAHVCLFSEWYVGEDQICLEPVDDDASGRNCWRVYSSDGTWQTAESPSRFIFFKIKRVSYFAKNSDQIFWFKLAQR